MEGGGGKTYGAIQWLTSEALRHPQTIHWWLSPSYRQARIALQYFFDIYPSKKVPILKQFFKAENKLELINKSIIEFKSADRPEMLEGVSLKGLVIDEAGITLKDEMIWHRSLRPTLSDNFGRLVAIGTPKQGTPLFKQFYDMGQDPNYPDWISFNMPSYTGQLGQHKFEKELAILKKTMPFHVYEQEIEAKFIQDGSLFRHIVEICILLEEKPDKKKHYVMGIDFAKRRDYTVITIGYENKCVYMEKLSHEDFSLQLERIKDIVREWSISEIFFDRTGLGDPISEALNMMFPDIYLEGIYFTHEVKTNIINNLALLFEQQKIKIVHNEDVIDELRNFNMDISPSGKIVYYGAHHDDIVISLALLFWGLKDVRPSNIWLDSFGKRLAQDFPQATT